MRYHKEWCFFWINIKHIIPASFYNLILATPLSVSSSQEDFIKYAPSKDGIFNIKSAYNSLLQPSINSSNNRNFFFLEEPVESEGSI